MLYDFNNVDPKAKTAEKATYLINRRFGEG